MLGFDDYPDIAARLRSIVAGEAHQPHTPQDRRRLLPISPVDRGARSSYRAHGASTSSASARPAPARAPYAAGSTAARWPPLKLASGCDRRCSFCAIPSFRGSFVSRRPQRRAGRGALAGRRRACASCSWSARTPRRTARTSATCACSRRCCPSWPRSTASSGSGCPTSSRPRPGPGWSRRSRRRPAWRRTSTCRSSTPARRCCAGCAASATPRASSACSTGSARWRPRPGVRSNVIVGFPGETEDDLETLCDFLVAARMDVTGVFGYSDEDGTEAATYDGKLDEDEVRARVEHVTGLVEELDGPARRGADRRGGRGARREHSRTGDVEGRAAHQGPEVDGTDVPGRTGVRRSATWCARSWPAPRAPTCSRGSCDDPGRAPAQQLERAQRPDHACGS